MAVFSTLHKVRCARWLVAALDCRPPTSSTAATQNCTAVSTVALDCGPHSSGARNCTALHSAQHTLALCTRLCTDCGRDCVSTVGCTAVRSCLHKDPRLHSTVYSHLHSCLHLGAPLHSTLRHLYTRCSAQLGDILHSTVRRVLSLCRGPRAELHFTLLRIVRNCTRSQLHVPLLHSAHRCTAQFGTVWHSTVRPVHSTVLCTQLHAGLHKDPRLHCYCGASVHSSCTQLHTVRHSCTRLWPASVLWCLHSLVHVCTRLCTVWTLCGARRCTTHFCTVSTVARFGDSLCAPQSRHSTVHEVLCTPWCNAAQLYSFLHDHFCGIGTNSCSTCGRLVGECL